MVALAVSAAIRTPLTLYAHSLKRRRAKLLHLIQAQYAQIGLGLRRKAVTNLRERVLKAVRKRSKATFKVFSIDESKSIWGGLISLPIFLSNLEVIRRMCGGPRGLIGNLLHGWETTTTPTATGAAETEAASSGPASFTGDAISVADVSSPTSLGDLTSTTSDTLSSISMEPTFATGGCLWFPNLLVPDPYHILPFAVSALLFAHMIPETTAERRDLFGLKPLATNGKTMTVGGGRSRMWRALQRSLIIMALAIGPATMDMPAALHLYWMTSVGCSLAVTKGVKKLMPITKSSVKPCTGIEIPLLRPKPL
ncbi:Mitochondrial inner membrane protein OXA1L [Cytospora mali]|uniref:Mitochondrial inner membrane protein OXA1L n=1 Tax=Cytospora mali TaxID=578113 RepID=A0A194UNW9_CYTMA|nr:Mitochondrial inner membrane protein OXA1L [Valsa mali var. pyri (nom. inval.)]